MAVSIPGHGGDAVASIDAKAAEDVGETAGAMLDGGVISAVDMSLAHAGDDFRFGVPACCVPDDRRQKQFLLLHETEHRVASLTIMCFVKYRLRRHYTSVK